MARGTGPLFSLEATGSIGDALTYGKRGRANVIKRKAQPANPRTIAQIQSRAAVAAATELWNTMSDTDKESWREPAEQRDITLYNAFVSYQLSALKQETGPRLNRTGGSAPGSDAPSLNNLEIIGRNIHVVWDYASGPFEGETVLTCLKHDVGGATPIPSTTCQVHLVNSIDQALAQTEAYVEKLPPGDYRLGLITVGTNGEIGEQFNAGLFTIT